MILALSACASMTAAPPTSQPSSDVAFGEAHFPPAPPKIALVSPFAGLPAGLEPLPAPTQDLWDRIVRGYAIPDVEGPLVDQWEQWYEDRPDYVARMIERSRRYLYHIVTEVQRRHMPLDLALLPMVESAFNPTALSSARASGIWQFMPATGRTWGLEQNWWFDSRLDIVAATNSALDYLQQLYTDLGDWQLALAAYNWGEGNVQRAVAHNRARGLPTDFASLRGVPAETRNYLPKLQAIKNIVADPERFHLALADIPDAPYFTIVRTTVQMDVKRAAELAEMPLDEFLALNPQHKRPVISGADDYDILLPIDKAEIFAAKLDLINQPLVSWEAHRVVRGETLSQVALRYGMSLETLKSVNGIGPHSTVPPGYCLLVPTQRPSEANAASLENAVFTTVPIGRTFYYRVHRGDTLNRLAARYGVSTEDIRHWNHLASDRLRTGQRLRITSDAVRAPVREARSAHTRVARGTAATHHGRHVAARSASRPHAVHVATRAPKAAQGHGAARHTARTRVAASHPAGKHARAPKRRATGTEIADSTATGRASGTP
ncbi:MAG TPA: LysM peptidoglycan-binding domain-containing protein [Casimicrobiaceae bacterium]